jgi:transposase
LVFIASKIGCTPETLRKWVRRTEVDQGQPAGMTTFDREQLLELKRENRELKRAHEILHKGSTFSPGRSSTADRNTHRFY